MEITFKRLKSLQPVDWVLQKLRQTTPKQQKLIRRAVILLAGIIVVQMLYPRNNLRPNTHVLGMNVGFRSHQSVIEKIESNGDSKISVQVQNTRIPTSLADMGLAISGKETIQSVQHYSFAARLVPFSLFARQSDNTYGLTAVNSQKTGQFLTTVAVYDKAPVSASIKSTGATFTVSPAIDGYSFSNESAQKLLASQRLSSNYELALPRARVDPPITTDTANKVMDRVTRQIESGFELSVDGQKTKVDQPTLYSWMVFTPNESKREITISYNSEAISTFIAPFAQKVQVAQTPKKVTTVDGVATDQTPGKSGRALNVSKSAEQVVASLRTNKKNGEVVIDAVEPTTQNSASYTRSSKGLQALIAAWVKSHKGTYYVAIKDTSGNISASHNPYTKVTPASLYKLYVADIVYTKAANNQLDLNSVAVPGKTISDCIDVMIVRSDNPCAIALADMVGREANDGFLADQGFGSTTLQRATMATTANDMANFLLKLHSGRLINSSSTKTLLSHMNRQIYRSGIPAGSAGTVANKVGFIDALNHDAAIVYHPKGTYALVIMTSGSNFANIADLSRQISNVMSQ